MASTLSFGREEARGRRALFTCGAFAEGAVRWRALAAAFVASGDSVCGAAFADGAPPFAWLRFSEDFGAVLRAFSGLDDGAAERDSFFDSPADCGAACAEPGVWLADLEEVRDPFFLESSADDSVRGAAGAWLTRLSSAGLESIFRRLFSKACVRCTGPPSKCVVL